MFRCPAVYGALGHRELVFTIGRIEVPRMWDQRNLGFREDELSAIR